MTRGVLRFALVGYVLMLLYGGWMPFHFHGGPAVQAEFQQAIHAWPVGPASELRKTDVVVNLLILAPVGFLLAGINGTWSRRRILAISFLVAAATSATIEVGQLFLDNRQGSLSDFTLGSLSGVLGAAAGILVFGPVAKWFWAHVGPHLKGKPGYLGAAAIAACVLIATAWPLRFKLGIAHSQWQSISLDVWAGFGSLSWFEWLWRQVACYILVTLLLICPGASRVASRRRVMLAILAGVYLALVAQAIHLMLTGPAPNLTKIAVGAASCVFAGVVGPHLLSSRLQLRGIVLAAAIVLLGLSVYAEYLAINGGLGRETSLPLWSLYWHESLYEAYRTLWRCVSVASLAFAAAYYLSLRTRLPMRRRLLLATLISGLCVTGAEIVKRILWPGLLDWAGMGEQLLASATGAILFAVVWRLLDRRGVTCAAAYAGKDRRQSAYTGPDRRAR